MPSRDTLCSIHAITTSGIAKCAIKHIFYTNQIHGGIISRLFFIHFCRPQNVGQFYLAVKNITSNLLYEDLSTLALHTSVGCISPECQQDRTLLRNQYY